MTTRLRVATSGKFADADDIASNAAVGRFVRCVPGTAGAPNTIEFADSLVSVVSVPTLAALVALADVGFGQLVRVDSVGRLFEFTPPGTSALQPMVVLAGIGGDWQSLQGTSDQRWQDATDWYLDGTNGDDENSGIVPGSPIKTGAEFLRRMNNARVTWSHNVEFHLLTSIAYLSLDYSLVAPNLTVKVNGVPVTVAVNGSDTSVIGWTPSAGNTPRKISVAGVNWSSSGPGGSSLVNRRLRVVAGAAASIGAVAWVLKTAPDAGDPVSVARISRPTKNPAVLLSNGDTIVIEDLPAIDLLEVHFGGYVYQGFTIGVGQLQVANVAVTSNCVVWGFSYYNYGCSFTGCKFTANLYGENWAHRIAGYLVGSLIQMAQFSGFATVDCAWIPYAGGSSVVVDGSFTVLSGDTFQGVRLAQIAPTLQLESEVYLMDSPGDALSLARGCRLSLASPVRGYGSIGAGMRVTALGWVMYTTGQLPTVTGALGDCILQPQATVIPWSALPWDDGYRPLSAVLAGGTRIVPVPFMLTTQKVLASKDTPTAAGELSVPTATITNTQFVVNSSNVADASSINCVVNPTGWGHWIVAS